MKKIKGLFAILVLLSLLLGACTPSATPTFPSAPTDADFEEIEVYDDPESAPPTKTTPSMATPPAPPVDVRANPGIEPTPFTPVELTDTLGNTLTLDEPPVRIISLAPSITEILYAIGAGDLLVGRTDFDNYPEAVLELPSVGGVTADTMSMEVIIDLEPDFILGGSVWQADLIDTLNENGMPSLTFEPNNLDEIMDLMLLLGDATGHAADAASAVEQMKARVSVVASVVETIPQSERVTLFYEVWHEPLMTTTNRTFIGEIITLAGGENIFGDLEETYPAVSAEEIIAANPDVILGPTSHGDQLTAEVIAKREGWSELSAVQNNAIYLIDGDIISRAGPRVVDALEAVASALYPAYFESLY